MIHLNTLVGKRVTTLRPLLHHYRTLGVHSFIVNVHVTAPDDPVLAAVRRIVDEFGVSINSVATGSWQEVIQKVYAESRSRYAGDWHILADQDEFHSYPVALAELEHMCNRRGYDYVSGCLIDRIAGNGQVPEVEPDRSLWDQFPVGAFFSWPVARADPRKVVFARSDVEIVKGQHFACTGRGCPIAECFVQVHHFKWVAGVTEMLEARLASLKAGGYPHHVESSRFLQYLKERGGRIDVNDGRFLAVRCAQDYPYSDLIQKWMSLVAEVSFIGAQIGPGPAELLAIADDMARRASKMAADFRAVTAAV